MRITIEGEPLADQRPRHMRNGHTYDPLASKKKAIKKKIEHKMANIFETGSSQEIREASNLTQKEFFSVKATFYLTPLKKLDQFKKNGLSWGFQDYANHRIDLDNLLKFLLDVCNGVLYADDRMVTSIVASKKYCNNPRTEIDIMPEPTQEISPQVEIFLKYFTRDAFDQFIQDMKMIFDTYYVANANPDLEILAPAVIAFIENHHCKLNKIKNANAKKFRDGKTLS